MVTLRAVLALASVLLAGCAGPAPKTAGDPAGAGEDGASLDGTWRATDAELGSMTVVIDGEGAEITAVDGQRFEVDGSLSRDEGVTELRGELEVGDPGLQVLFGPKDTHEVEGTINFAMGRAQVSFRRFKKDAFLDGCFWRASRAERTARTIRLTQVPGKP